jgi:pSer/pThr/pTyr-binding forkhead associated (FHA) protein
MRFSEAPTEKRTRPTVDLWKEDYTPPPAVVHVDPSPSDDAAGSFSRSKITRGRGSSGDPSEISPNKGPGSGSFGLPGKRTAPEVPAGPEGPLLEPNRRKPPTGTFDALNAPPTVTPTTGRPTPAPKAPPADAAPEVLGAVQAANEAAKTRKKLDPSEVAQFAGALDFGADDGAEAPIDDQASPTAAPTAPPPRQMTPGSAPRPDTAAPGMPHYLVTQVLSEPYALSRTQVVRIGRGEDNEIIFPLSQVSRHHAEVRFDQAAGNYVIIDRNSINGTLVNGKAVKRRKLADGDRIAIGPFTMVYRASTGGSRMRAMDETDVIRPGSLAGELSDMPIADVVRFIEALRKTGELTVIAPTGERGTILFRDGQPIHAEFKVTLGPQAAVALFKLKGGNFRFAVKTIEVPRASISAPLATLLAEASV